MTNKDKIFCNELIDDMTIIKISKDRKRVKLKNGEWRNIYVAYRYISGNYSFYSNRYKSLTFDDVNNMYSMVMCGYNKFYTHNDVIKEWTSSKMQALLISVCAKKSLNYLDKVMNECDEEMR